MGKASFWSDEVPVTGPRREIINETMVFGRIPYPVTCLSVGNPHLVILMDEISKELVCRIGKYSENARQFPEKINTQIMKVLDRTHIQTEVYERGAGYTLASGSGCCAAAAAAYRLGLTDPKMIVQMSGGTLELEIREDGNVHSFLQIQAKGRGIASDPRPDTFYRDWKGFLPSLGEGG